MALDSDSDSGDNEPLISVDDWPRFVVLTSTTPDRPLNKLSPFFIAKGILGIVGTEIKDVKKLQSGDLLVECGKKAHAHSLLLAKTLHDVSIEAYAHKTLNSSKGVI